MCETDSCQLRAWRIGSASPLANAQRSKRSWDDVPEDVRGQQVVLQADAPLLAGHEIDRDAQRAVGVRHTRGLGERADQAPPDEILVLVARFEAVWSQPPRVEVGASLPGPIPDLEEVGEVALERDLEEHRHRRARVRVEGEVLMHLMKADQPVDGHGDAGLAHVATRPGDVVGDHVPARVTERKPHRSH